MVLKKRRRNPAEEQAERFFAQRAPASTNDVEPGSEPRRQGHRATAAERRNHRRKLRNPTMSPESTSRPFDAELPSIAPLDQDLAQLDHPRHSVRRLNYSSEIISKTVLPCKGRLNEAWHTITSFATQEAAHLDGITGAIYQVCYPPRHGSPSICSRNARLKRRFKCSPGGKARPPWGHRRFSAQRVV